MGQFTRCILEEDIAWVEFGTNIIISSRSLLQLRHLLDCMWDLEDEHSSANMLADIVSTWDCWNESSVLLCTCWLAEVHWKVVEELRDDFIWIIQSDKKIIWYGQLVVSQIRNNNHLGLLESTPQIEVVEIFVKCHKSNPCSISARQSAFIDDALDGRRGLSKVPRIDSLLRDIQEENVGRRHWRSVCILRWSDEVNWSAVELGPLVYVKSLSCLWV